MTRVLRTRYIKKFESIRINLKIELQRIIQYKSFDLTTVCVSHFLVFSFFQTHSIYDTLSVCVCVCVCVVFLFHTFPQCILLPSPFPPSNVCSLCVYKKEWEREMVTNHFYNGNTRNPLGEGERDGNKLPWELPFVTMVTNYHW